MKTAKEMKANEIIETVENGDGNYGMDVLMRYVRIKHFEESEVWGSKLKAGM